MMSSCFSFIPPPTVLCIALLHRKTVLCIALPQSKTVLCITLLQSKPKWSSAFELGFADRQRQ